MVIKCRHICGCNIYIDLMRRGEGLLAVSDMIKGGSLIYTSFTNRFGALLTTSDALACWKSSSP